MPVSLDGQNYYRTAEVCQMAGISRNTLFRWLKEGMIREPARRDWRGWRLFTQAQVDQLKERTIQSIESKQFAMTTDFFGGLAWAVLWRYHGAWSRNRQNT